MSATEIVKAGLAATQAGDFQKLGSMLTDDMVFAGPVPVPVGKREFLGLQSALVAAIPDWNFNATDFKENGNEVAVMLRITGTNTQELNLPMPGFPKVPATGKSVSLPNELTTFTVKDGKITRIDVTTTPGGGVPGILLQLGIPMPH